MEKITILKKKKKTKIQEIEEINKMYGNEALESKVFVPHEVCRIVQENSIAEIALKLKSNGYLSNIVNFVSEKKDLILIEIPNKALYDKILDYQKNKEEVLSEVINNVSDYKTTRTKTDIGLLQKISFEMPIDKRTTKNIMQEYNKNENTENISSQTVY